MWALKAADGSYLGFSDDHAEIVEKLNEAWLFNAREFAEQMASSLTDEPWMVSGPYMVKQSVERQSHQAAIGYGPGRLGTDVDESIASLTRIGSALSFPSEWPDWKTRDLVFDLGAREVRDEADRYINSSDIGNPEVQRSIVRRQMEAGCKAALEMYGKVTLKRAVVFARLIAKDPSDAARLRAAEEARFPTFLPPIVDKLTARVNPELTALLQQSRKLLGARGGEDVRDVAQVALVQGIQLIASDAGRSLGLGLGLDMIERIGIDTTLEAVGEALIRLGAPVLMKRLQERPGLH